MAKKKKRQEIPPQVASRAQAWLEGLADDPDAALAALIEEASSDEMAATAFIQLLAAHPGEEAAYVAARVAQATDRKAVRKAAKRAVYLLKQKGVEVPEFDRSRPIFRLAETPEAFGFLSGYYPDGSQVIFLALSRPGGEGACGAARAHFLTGILEIELGPMRLRRFETMVTESEPDLPWGPARVEGPDLIRLLRRIVAHTRNQAGPLSPHVGLLVTWLEGQGPEADPPALYPRLGVDPAVRPQPADLRRAAELLGEPPCNLWWPDEARWTEAIKRLEGETDTSLVLSQAIEAERKDRLLAAIAQDLFPEEEWEAWQGRLEDTALFLAASGQEEEARIFLAAAASPWTADHPLLVALTERAWEVHQAEKTDKEEEGEPDQLATPSSDSGLIVPPSGSKE